MHVSDINVVWNKMLAFNFSLVVQLIRDLQSDFYPYFPRALQVIVRTLSHFHKDVAVLEAAFTTLAYLFKFLWRRMVDDIENVFR